MSKSDAMKVSRKETQKIVFEKLSDAMAEYKSNLKEKKLVTNLKKISKLFAADIVKATVKQNEEAKKERKKAVRGKKEKVTEPVPVN